MKNYRVNQTVKVAPQPQKNPPVFHPQLPSWTLTPRQLCDFEMLVTGFFSPLSSFMGKADYDSVIATLRLSNGRLWPFPVVLDVSKTFADHLQLGETIALKDAEGVILANFLLEERWLPNKSQEAQQLYGSQAISSLAVNNLLRSGEVYLGGQIQLAEVPTHHAFINYRQTPTQVQAYFSQHGLTQITGLHVQQVVHRALWETACYQVKNNNTGLLLQYEIGLSQQEERKHFSRIRCYENVLRQTPTQPALLNLVNHFPRQSETRDILCTALILKNYGCSHFLVKPEHMRFLQIYQEEIGLSLLEMHLKSTSPLVNFSDAELGEHLRLGLSVPANFSFPKVLTEIQKAYPSRQQQGFAVFFTGLSGSGKSTLANGLLVKLMEIDDRAVTLLDGDVVRKHLSSELNFSREHRDINIRRIGFVASEIVKSGGIALCAPIAPYANVRQEIRKMISSKGGFIEIHISTPLAECEKRDRKGLYAKARNGILKGFTGIDDPYEIPENPELRLDTSQRHPEECTDKIITLLIQLGYLSGLEKS